jgi:hypothetical protein
VITIAFRSAQIIPSVLLAICTLGTELGAVDVVGGRAVWVCHRSSAGRDGDTWCGRSGNCEQAGGGRGRGHERLLEVQGMFVRRALMGHAD